MSIADHFLAGAAARAEGLRPPLQAILSSSSAGASDVPVVPHHPITCPGELRLHDDGRLSCQHATAPPGEQRIQQCIDHSIAILLLELAREL
jgi:hypothetical protein